MNEYEEIARRRLEEEVFSKDRSNDEEPLPVQREKLKPREYKVNIWCVATIKTYFIIHFICVG